MKQPALTAVFAVLGLSFAEPGFRGCAFISASAEASPGSAVGEVADEYRTWVRSLFLDLAQATGATDPERLAQQLVLLYDGAGIGAWMDRDPGAAAAAQAVAAVLVDAATGPSVGKENSTSIDLYYEDHGSGKPVVLIHGWPLSGASWEKQVPVLVAEGHRVITYDRRGFGRSSQPTSGYDYDTFAEDLHGIMTELDLRDATLVGFSMGGGEVARYLGKYGSERVSKAVFMAAVPPFLLKTLDNPTGVDGGVFEGIKQAIAADPPAFLSQFLANFYNVDVLGGKQISDEVVRLSWNIAAGASPKGTLDCVSAWVTDFRNDVRRIDVPTLVVHGDADRILPVSATAAPTHEAVNGSRLVVVNGGPHGLNWTHADEVNRELIAFLK